MEGLKIHSKFPYFSIVKAVAFCCVYYTQAKLVKYTSLPKLFVNVDDGFDEEDKKEYIVGSERISNCMVIGYSNFSLIGFSCLGMITFAGGIHEKKNMESYKRQKKKP